MIEPTQAPSTPATITKGGKAGHKDRGALFAKLMEMFQKQLKAMQSNEKLLTETVSDSNTTKNVAGTVKLQGSATGMHALRLHIDDMVSALKSMHTEGQNLDFNAEELLISIQEMGIPIKGGDVDMEALFAASISGGATGERSEESDQPENRNFESTSDLLATALNASARKKSGESPATTRQQEGVTIQAPDHQKGGISAQTDQRGQIVTAVNTSPVTQPSHSVVTPSEVRMVIGKREGESVARDRADNKTDTQSKELGMRPSAPKGVATGSLNQQEGSLSVKIENRADHIRPLTISPEQTQAHNNPNTRSDTATQHVSKETASLAMVASSQDHLKRQVRTHRAEVKIEQRDEVAESVQEKKSSKANIQLQSATAEALKTKHTHDAVRTLVQSETGTIEQDMSAQKIVDLPHTETRPQRSEFQTHLNALKSTRPMPLVDAMNEISRAAKDGKVRLEIQLEPAHLGKINISLQTDAAKQVQVHFIVEQGASRQLIEQNLPLLRSAMAQQGLELGSFSMQQGDHRDPSGFHDDQQQRGGQTFERGGIDTSIAAPPAHNDTAIYSGSGRLSIRA